MVLEFRDILPIRAKAPGRDGKRGAGPARVILGRDLRPKHPFDARAQQKGAEDRCENRSEDRAEYRESREPIMPGDASWPGMCRGGDEDEASNEALMLDRQCRRHGAPEGMADHDGVLHTLRPERLMDEPRLAHRRGIARAVRPIAPPLARTVDRDDTVARAKPIREREELIAR